MRFHTSGGKSPAPALDPQEVDDEQPDVFSVSRIASADVGMSRLSSETKFAIECSWATACACRHLPFKPRARS